MSIAVGNAERFLRRFRRWMKEQNRSPVPIVENGNRRKSSRDSPLQKVQPQPLPAERQVQDGFPELSISR